MKPVFVSKYEATKCMKQHIISIHNSEASKETSRWRHTPSFDNVRSSKKQQYHKMDEVINEKNKLLSERLYKVVTEDRVHRTKEAGPGWRSGVGGTVIDCYPTENKQVLYYKKFRAENRDRASDWKQQQLNEANVEFYSYLAATKPSYGVDQLAKEYRKNRVSYDLYANRPNTALTLGIYDVAAKEIAKEKIKREGYRSHANYSSSELNHKVEEMWQAKKNNTGASSKMVKKLQEVKSVADFIDMNVASIEEKWNPTVNDNLRNSSSNFVMVENRLKPGYVGKREFDSSYLSDVPSASQTIKNSTAFAVEGRRGSGGMKVDYDQILFNEMEEQHRHNQHQQQHLLSRSSSGAESGGGRVRRAAAAGTSATGRSYEEFEFNLYEPKGSSQVSPPPIHHSRPKSSSALAHARPTSGGTMQYADSRGVRDLTQYQHSIEEVSEFNFQNLRAEYIEHFMEQQEGEEDEEVQEEVLQQQQYGQRVSVSSSPGGGVGGKRPVSAGATLMKKVHHTKATAAAAAASLLPPERPVTPTYALPKLNSPTNKEKAAAAAVGGGAVISAAPAVPKSTLAAPVRSTSPVGRNKESNVGKQGATAGGGGIITFHENPVECLQVDRNLSLEQYQRRPLSSGGRELRRERQQHQHQQYQQMQRPHSTGGYRDYSGATAAAAHNKKNVSFDNKLDSTIILDYSQTSDSVAAAAIAAVSGSGVVGNSSSSTLEESNIMFLNQY